MSTHTEDTLAKARIHRWHDVGSGLLVVEPTKLVVYRRRFLAQMKQAASFETNLLKSVNPDTEAHSVSLILEMPQGEPLRETFCFVDARELEAVLSVLSCLLKSLQEEESRREAEAARLQREAQLRSEQVRREFAAGVWRTAEVVWSLAEASYSTEKAVIAGDWSEGRRQYSIVWQQADKLKDMHGFDLTAALENLDHNVQSENGEGVVRQMGPFLKALVDKVLQTEALWARWRTNEIVATAISPNWYHLPYFLLFTCAHFEVMLSLEIEDWAGVANGVCVLRDSAPVLRECFNVDLDGLVKAAESASAVRNARSVSDNASQIESLLVSSFKTHPFEYAEPEEERNGKHESPLPEPA